MSFTANQHSSSIVNNTDNNFFRTTFNVTDLFPKERTLNDLIEDYINDNDVLKLPQEALNTFLERANYLAETNPSLLREELTNVNFNRGILIDHHNFILVSILNFVAENEIGNSNTKERYDYDWHDPDKPTTSLALFDHRDKIRVRNIEFSDFRFSSDHYNAVTIYREWCSSRLGIFEDYRFMLELACENISTIKSCGFMFRMFDSLTLTEVLREAISTNIKYQNLTRGLDKLVKSYQLINPAAVRNLIEVIIDQHDLTDIDTQGDEMLDYLKNLYKCTAQKYAHVPKWVLTKDSYADENVVNSLVSKYETKTRFTYDESVRYAFDFLNFYPPEDVKLYPEDNLENIRKYMQSITNEYRNYLTLTYYAYSHDYFESDNMKLDQLLGPLNLPLYEPNLYYDTVEQNINHYRMFVGRSFDPVTQDITEFDDYFILDDTYRDWFTGSCAYCMDLIRSYRHALRRASISGGFDDKCFCRDKCITDSLEFISCYNQGVVTEADVSDYDECSLDQRKIHIMNRHKDVMFMLARSKIIDTKKYLFDVDKMYDNSGYNIVLKGKLLKEKKKNCSECHCDENICPVNKKCHENKCNDFHLDANRRNESYQTETVNKHVSDGRHLEETTEIEKDIQDRLRFDLEDDFERIETDTNDEVVNMTELENVLGTPYYPYDEDDEYRDKMIALDEIPDIQSYEVILSNAIDKIDNNRNTEHMKASADEESKND